MFDSTIRRAKRDGSRLAGDVHGYEEAADRPDDEGYSPDDYSQLDVHEGVTEADPNGEAGDRMFERHGRLMETLKDERDRQSENRWQMAKDEDYFDGLQWEPEDAQELMDRGQAPLVFNKVKPIANWITGTEKRTRIDFKVLPREQADEQGAEVKTKALKYVSDVNRTAFHRSAAFKECVSAGLGWLEDGINTDPESELIFSGHESWRNILHDSRDRQFDTSRMRYQHRTKTLDLDVARAMFPKAGTHLDGVAERSDYLGDREDGLWYLGERLTNSVEEQARHAFGERSAFVGTSYVDSGRRDVVRIIESWYRVPEPVEFFANGPFAGKPCNPADPQHVMAKRGGAVTFSHVAMRMRCMLSTEDAPLWDGASWYKHNRFPFTPLWCYRRARDGMPYGIIRGIRDIQDDFNKRRSKALHVLSVNRVIVDEDSVDDIEALRQEAARADSVLVKKRGSTLAIEKAAAEINGNLELMQSDEALMQDVAGVTGENLGHQTNAASGRAILARQEQGSMVTADIFDNLRLGIQMQGEKQLSLVEQYMTQPKVLRIVGTRKPIEWVAINQIDEATGEVHDDITARQADFIVSEQDYRSSLQQAAFEQLSEMLTKIAQFNPQVVTNLLDLLVDLADIPNKDEFVARIRKLTGQADPTKPPTPEEQAAAQKAQQLAEIQEQISLETLKAQLEKVKNEAAKLGAQTVTEHVNALLQAITAGSQVVMAPGIAPVADAIVKQSGWTPNAGADPNIVQPAQPPQAAPMPEQPQPEPVGAM